MRIEHIFEHFAADFEAAVLDDNWSRLEKYLTEDATYVNVGGPDPQCRGRAAILAYLRKDVAETDRHFDTRRLIALTPPAVEGDRLSRRWRCTYTLAGTPDLVLEGEARYLFEGDHIRAIAEELTANSMQKLAEWMQQYADRLQPRG